MNERGARAVKYTPWRSSGSREPIAPSRVPAEWNRLLDRLGLTEPEALAAIVEHRDTDQTISRFVRQEFHVHFVPEDVLFAMHLERDVPEDDS